MAVQILSGNSTDLQTVDPVSKAARITLYDSAGDEVIQSLPISITTVPVTAQDNDLISSLDVSAYKFISFQLTGIWVGEVIFQGSNDNGTFYDIAAQDPRQLATPYILSLTANGLIKIPVIFKYLRIRASEFTSGTITGTAFGYKEENSTGQISSTGQVTVVDANGQVAGPMKVSVDGSNHLPTAITQESEVSNNNTSVADVDAGATFVGLAENTSGINSLDLQLHANEPLTVTVQQSNDGADWSTEDTFTMIADVAAGRSVKSIAAWFRLRVTNTGAARTTHFSVSTTLTPISEPLPRALTQEGSLKTAVMEPLPAGANEIGSLGGSVETIGFVKVLPLIATAPVPLKIVSGVGTNETLVKVGAANLHFIWITSVGDRFLKLYDQATVPVVGTDVPLYTFPIAVGANAIPVPAGGFNFANGFAYAIDLSPGDDTATPFTVAGEVMAMLAYT